MSRALRIFLTCLLTLALPLQGYAAQRMLFCAPASHQAAQVSPMQAGHEHAAHGHGHSSKADAKAPVHEPVHAKFTPGKLTPGKCSACASCCGAVAIISSPLVFSPNPPAHDYTASVVPSYSGHTPDRLDRPPRSTLA